MAGLQGKNIVVTGAAQGIGAQIARRLSHEGATVVLADRAAAKAQAVAHECGSGARAVECDLGDPDSIMAMAVEAAGDGAVHGLVNAAAIFSTIEMRPFWEIPVAEWDTLMAVNLRGPWLLTSALLPALRRAGGASVVHIASDALWQGRPGYLHYVASKGGVLGLTFSMATELGTEGIRVNAISPAAVMTEVPRATVTEAQKEAMLAANAIKRFAGPDDIAGAAVYLLSDDSEFVTGQSLSINGGLGHR